MQEPDRVLGSVDQNAKTHRTGHGSQWAPTEAYWSDPSPANEAAATARIGGVLTDPVADEVSSIIVRAMRSLEQYRQKIDGLQERCPVRAAVDVIRGRWKPSILFELNSGPRRFTDLQTALRGITPQALSLQLRQLEADGVVARSVFADEVPVRVEYSLTQAGRSLSGVMDQLEQWGLGYLARRPARKPRAA